MRPPWGGIFDAHIKVFLQKRFAVLFCICQKASKQGEDTSKSEVGRNRDALEIKQRHKGNFENAEDASTSYSFIWNQVENKIEQKYLGGTVLRSINPHWQVWTPRLCSGLWSNLDRKGKRWFQVLVDTYIKLVSTSFTQIYFPLGLHLDFKTSDAHAWVSVNF